MQFNDRSNYSFEEWSELVRVARPDFCILRFDGEREAIACYRAGDELYRLDGAIAILCPVFPPVASNYRHPDEVPNHRGTLTTGKSYPVVDPCEIPFSLPEEESIALGHRASFIFDY